MGYNQAIGLTPGSAPGSRRGAFVQRVSEYSQEGDSAVSAGFRNVQGQDPARISPGPVLLLAGPGTGKTYQLARRIKWLVEDCQEPADHVTVLTFTDEATRNMRERLSDPLNHEVYVPAARQPARISTMHSLGYQVVREHCERLGFAEAPKLLPRHLVTVVLGDAAQLLGLPRDRGTDVAAGCRRRGRCAPSDDRDECRVCDRYSSILRSQSVLDYDDQILLACQLFRDDEQVLSAYRQAAAHLLVDEYQDINAAQFELIRLLAGPDASGLYATGDDNQSIYSFRGGAPEYIRGFTEHWPNAAVARLDVSRRCPQSVVKCGAAVITQGCRQPLNDPLVRSCAESDALVTIHAVGNATHEASRIARTIADVRGAQDALILVPRSAYAPPLKRALRRWGIPYDCRTGVEDSGLHVLNELTRWLEDPRENFALRVLIECILENSNLYRDLGRPRHRRLDEWRSDMRGHVSRLWEPVERRRWSLYAALRRHDEDSPLHPVLAVVEELRELKGADPDALLAVATRVLRPWSSRGRLTGEITEWVEDNRSRDRAHGRPAARVLTMASAKGLEADLVFIVGLEEGSFPYPRATGPDLEEQYRLLYVSMTRAKQELHLYYARSRPRDVSYRPQSPGDYAPPRPAPFLKWLSDDACVWQEHWRSGAARKRRTKKRAT